MARFVAVVLFAACSPPSGGGEVDADADAGTDRLCRDPCTVDSECPGGGLFPYRHVCREGYCWLTGCANDAECEAQFGAPVYRCFAPGGSTTRCWSVPECHFACETDDDCVGDLFCIGEDANGGRYCAIDADLCANDGCRADGECNTGSVCEIPTGRCYCEDDAACAGDARCL